MPRPKPPRRYSLAQKRRYRSTAWPLALGYALLIAYASLYPFSGWRFSPDPWWLYLTQWPKYWLRFDVISNFAGYIPLGFLAAASWLSYRPGQRNWPGLLLIALGGGLWSFAMESTQNFLPWRVPSMADLLLNSGGAACGVVLARWAQARGWIERWRSWRERSMLPHSRGLFVHLFLWPFALLFPTQHPFGLGHFLPALEGWAQPSAQYLEALQAQFSPAWAERFWTHWPSISVALGLLLPMGSMALLLRHYSSRLLGLLGVVLVGGLSLSLAFALSYDPQHAWVWATPPVLAGMAGAAVLGLGVVVLPRRVLAWALLVLLGLHMVLLNFAPISSYTRQEMASWKQGEFVRFYGLSEWLSWLWPYVLGLMLLLFLWQLGRERQGR